jgi:hypothetical protein
MYESSTTQKDMSKYDRFIEFLLGVRHRGSLYGITEEDEFKGELVRLSGKRPSQEERNILAQLPIARFEETH